MSRDIITEKCQHLIRRLREKWPDPTKGGLTGIAGKKHRPAGRLLEKYGRSRDEGGRRIDDFFRDKG